MTEMRIIIFISCLSFLDVMYIMNVFLNLLILLFTKTEQCHNNLYCCQSEQLFELFVEAVSQLRANFWHLSPLTTWPPVHHQLFIFFFFKETEVLVPGFLDWLKG